MEAEIGEILSNHSRVRNLINIIGTKKSKNENNNDELQLYFAPADKGIQCLQIGDLSNESTTISNINALVNLVKTHKLEGQLKIVNKNRRFRTNLIQLCPIVYPKQVKLCPTIENIEQKMSDETLVVSIFSYTGYSFLAEYTHVYKSKFNKDKVFEDILVIIQRALRSSSPSLNDETCIKYSEFILRMSAWEAQLSSMVLDETNRAVFPSWQAFPSPVLNETDAHHIEVYIGHNTNGELSFTVRLRDELEMRAISSTKEAKNKQKTSELQDPDKLNTDIAIESIYYREFLLTDNVIETYNPVSYTKTTAGVSKNTGFGTIPPPPPPPRRNGQKDSSMQHDIRMFLLITQKIQPDDLLVSPVVPVVSNNSDNSNKEEKEIEKEVEEDQNTEAWIGRPLVSEKEASFCSELYGWGLDSSHSLGLGQYNGKKTSYSNMETGKKSNSSIVEEKVQGTDTRDMEELNEFIHGPRRIPVDRMIAMERVRWIACSSHHTLLLTHLGSVFGCGENSEGALGTGDFTSRSSLTLIDWPVSPTATGSGNIVKIAAGSSSIGAHSMAVDSAGCLYGWGVAYAVGLGQVKAITTPTAVPIGSFRNPLNVNRSVLTATNRTDTGVEIQGEVEEDLEFIDENDYVDTNNTTTNATNTTTNTTTTNNENNGNITQSTPSHSNNTFTAAERKEVVDVACGGGFTVCVTKSGHVYSWGVWAHGRLGLGPVPTVERMKGPYRGYSKKIARYQLHPRRIQGVEGAVSVSCGEAHTLCLLRNGCVLSWGQNSCGQLGNGPSSLGMLSDAYRPVLLPHFGSLGTALKQDYNVGRFAMRSGNEVYQAKLSQLLTNSTEKIPPSGRVVVCGAFHSVCIDQRGLVYTWGARGSPCLGHNDAAIVGDWNRRINSIFSIAATENRAMVPYELYPWCLTWSMPRCVQALAGGPLQSSLGGYGQEDDATSLGGGSTIGGVSASSEVHVSAKQRVVQVSAGDLCTAFLTAEGKFFLCGTGPAVPSFTPASQTLQDIDPNNNEENDEELDEKEEVLPTPCLVSSPRCPSDSWLREICTRKSSYVSTSGNRLFVVVEEEVISHSLTAPLLRTLMTGTEQSRFNKSTTGSDTDSHSQFDSVFENHGKADCMILASGKVFLCHKALLAQRSPELRDMIIMESPTDNSAGQLVQLLLPELQRDAARGLLHYLYRDVLPVWCISSTSILTSLARTGKTLRMPRLQLLCDRFLRLLRTPDLSTTEPDATPFGDLSELPPPTLARDMSALVGDPEFADVRFIAEGRAIVAHRFILEARCAYFRNMFRFHHQSNATSSHPSSGEIIDVVVPDTFVGFLRLLIFLYTGTLPDGSDGMLLEDLMAADRYVVPDMKLLCENMLAPSENNWLDLLRAAQLLNSLRLELQVMGFLKTNFSVLRGFYQSPKSDSTNNNNTTTNTNNTNNNEFNENKKKEFEENEEDVQYSNIGDFQEEFPYILNNLLETRKIIYPLPPSHKIIQQSTENNNILIKNKNNENIPVFPIYALIIACVSFFIYQHISKIIVLGPVIPIINVSGFLVFIAMAIKFFTK